MAEGARLESVYTLTGIVGSNPTLSAIRYFVRPGDIGDETFRRHGLHFWPEGVLKRLQSFLL